MVGERAWARQERHLNIYLYWTFARCPAGQERKDLELKLSPLPPAPAFSLQFAPCEETLSQTLEAHLCIVDTRALRGCQLSLSLFLNRLFYGSSRFTGNLRGRYRDFISTPPSRVQSLS